MSAVKQSGLVPKPKPKLKPKPKSNLMYLIKPHNSVNCEEGDGDYLNEVCIVTKEEFDSVCKKAIQCQLCIEDDNSCGGHGCIIQIECTEYFDSSDITEITETDAETVLRLGLATKAEACGWFIRIREELDEAETKLDIPLWTS